MFNLISQAKKKNKYNRMHTQSFKSMESRDQLQQCIHTYILTGNGETRDVRIVGKTNRRREECNR